MLLRAHLYGRLHLRRLNWDSSENNILSQTRPRMRMGGNQTMH